MKTYETNFIGTLNLLETLRKLKKCVVVLITSDKCYENKEWIWGYKETDQIGGIDPYSASKGACEIMIKSHIKSFFDHDSIVKIGIGRAGNVIGGGDWSGNRIVPDAVKSWAKKKTLILRNPQSTRPWQHVLEPLSGYLELACKLSYEIILFMEKHLILGLPQTKNYSVKHLIKEMSKHWNGAEWEDKNNKNKSFYESGLLKLNCDKALALLDWKPTLNFEQTVELTTIWYKKYYTKSSSKINNITFEQIELFEKFRNEKGKVFNLKLSLIKISSLKKISVEGWKCYACIKILRQRI